MNVSLMMLTTATARQQLLPGFFIIFISGRKMLTDQWFSWPGAVVTGSCFFAGNIR